VLSHVANAPIGTRRLRSEGEGVGWRKHEGNLDGGELIGRTWSYLSGS
jgi:hypothetical protein